MTYLLINVTCFTVTSKYVLFSLYYLSALWGWWLLCNSPSLGSQKCRYLHPMKHCVIYFFDPSVMRWLVADTVYSKSKQINTHPLPKLSSFHTPVHLWSLDKLLRRSKICNWVSMNYVWMLQHMVGLNSAAWELGGTPWRETGGNSKHVEEIGS